MELTIDFEELVNSFEESDVMHHYFIDTKNNEFVYINEDLDEDASEQLETMEDDRYLMIPPRFSEDEFLIMELFVYEKLQDDALAEKFNKILERKKPFRNFKGRLLDYPDLRDQWFVYHREHLKNGTISWLCEHNIVLTNQRLIPDIEIRELTNDEIHALSEEITDFHPVLCMGCQNEKGLARRLFLINVSPENRLIEQETKRIMAEQFNITDYGWWSGQTPNVLTVSRCPKCHSEHIIWDY